MRKNTKSNRLYKKVNKRLEGFLQEAQSDMERYLHSIDWNGDTRQYKLDHGMMTGGEYEQYSAYELAIMDEEDRITQYNS